MTEIDHIESHLISANLARELSLKAFATLAPGLWLLMVFPASSN
jgi:hypothetical protein